MTVNKQNSFHFEMQHFSKENECRSIENPLRGNENCVDNRCRESVVCQCMWTEPVPKGNWHETNRCTVNIAYCGSVELVPLAPSYLYSDCWCVCVCMCIGYNAHQIHMHGLRVCVRACEWAGEQVLCISCMKTMKQFKTIWLHENRLQVNRRNACLSVWSIV